MSSKDIPVIKFMFSSDFKVLTESLNLSSHGEVEEFQSAMDLSTFIPTVDACLILTSLKEKTDLVQLATFMKSVKKIAHNTAYKIVVINFSQNKQFEKAVAKLGIQDMVEPTINTKGLKFKMDFWMKSLVVQTKNNPSLQNKIKNSEQNKTTEIKTQDNQAPNWLAPLDLEDDIWLLNHESDCKKILSRWLIRFVGPGPFIGQWVDIKSNLWRFDFLEDDKEMFVSGSGAWFYFGPQKPEFVWKENIWLMSGDSFELFYKDGEKIFSRAKLKDKTLSISENSLYAKTKEQIIIESFDKELLFKKEADNLENLEGKGKTDQYSGGPLSGKNKTSHLDRSPLSGEVKSDDQAQSSDPLSQKTQTEREKTHWKGKNAYQNDEENSEAGPGVDAHRNGDEMGLDRKYLDHQKYYKGHNPATQYDGTEKEKEKQDKGLALEAELSGKSSTDKLNGHYKNALANASLDERKNENKDSAQRAIEAKHDKNNLSDLTEKNKTDHYSNLFGSMSEKQTDKSDQSTSLIPFSKINKHGRDEKRDPEIDHMTAETKVTSSITQNTIRLNCNLDDYFDEMIIFVAKNGKIKDGKIKLEMLFNYLGKDTKLKLEGEVITIDDDGEGNDYITIKIAKSSVREVESFMLLYEERQKNVYNFLETARGF